jgi:hypothetical protein
MRIRKVNDSFKRVTNCFWIDDAFSTTLFSGSGITA